MFGRLSATHKKLFLSEPAAPPSPAEPYHSPAELKADLDALDRSLRAHGGRLLARGRLRDLPAISICVRLPLGPVDLRQNSEVHGRVVAELLEAVPPWHRVSWPE